jgi:hypothetical protein
LSHPGPYVFISNPDKSVQKQIHLWVLYCNYHHINLKYFLHSDDWLPWQQPLSFGLKNGILGCVE